MELSMKKSLVVLFSLILLINFTSAYAIYVRPLDTGALQPNTAFTYEFNFSTNAACTNIVLSELQIITTDAYGIGFIDIDISTMSAVPSYVCEYKDGAIRQVHALSDQIFRDVYARNINATGIICDSNGCISPGNISWNQTYADTLYADISSAANKSFNQTFTDGLYSDIKWGYNQTSATYVLYDAEWSSTYNATYDSIIGDNESWNETLANTLYSDIIWGYNMSDGSYNATYILWAYNQTIHANAYTDATNSSMTSWIDTIFLKISDMFTKINIVNMISGNKTEILANNDTWSSTYNATYDALETNNNSWNETGANLIYSDIKWGYNMTTPANAYTDAEIITLNDTVVHTFGAETIDGVKTFSSFIILPSGSPVSDNQAVNKKYVDDFVTGLTWREPVLNISKSSNNSAPNPNIGDRYIISSPGADNWTGFDNHITEWNGTDWDMNGVPQAGWAVLSLDTSTGHTFDGSDWIIFSGGNPYFAGDGITLTGTEINVNIKDNDGLKLVAGELTLSYNSSIFTVVDGELTITTYAALQTNNNSWNQTFADTLYSGSEWAYNQTTPANEYTDATNSSMTSWIESTFIKVVEFFTKSQIVSMIFGNLTEAKEYTNTVISGNDSAWSSTYNVTYASGIKSVFINYTNVKTTGDISNGSLVGYAAGTAICNAEISGSHMCMMDEVLEAQNNNNYVNFTATFRVSEGAPGYLAEANDCGGWKDDTTSSLGAIWVGNNVDGGAGALVSCSAERAIGCCK